jgi:uncharacterized membrane protein YgdD (TMEM256/DUF423 family)
MTTANPVLTRTIIALAGLIGAGGVAAAAAATHVGDSANLGPIAMICLAHGPALLALGLSSSRGRLLGFAAILLGCGTLIFVGDLLTRHYMGQGAFPLAAPIGGIGMIGGWLAIVAGGLFSRAAGK